jgi:hypothetical protein
VRSNDEYAVAMMEADAAGELGMEEPNRGGDEQLHWCVQRMTAEGVNNARFEFTYFCGWCLFSLGAASAHSARLPCLARSPQVCGAHQLGAAAVAAMGRPQSPPPPTAVAAAPAGSGSGSGSVPTPPRFNLLLSFSDSVFCVLAMDAKLLYVSPSAQKVFNMDCQQTLGYASGRRRGFRRRTRAASKGTCLTASRLRACNTQARRA